MTTDLAIRLADPDRDADAIAAIYRPAVESSPASFEEVPPDAGEMADRVRGTLLRTPWLVAVSGGMVVGYAYAGQHHQRAGYRWSVDISAYVHPRPTGRGPCSAWVFSHTSTWLAQSKQRRRVSFNRQPG